jgi:ribosomal protein S18 acetylase RimI-like enzyme
MPESRGMPQSVAMTNPPAPPAAPAAPPRPYRPADRSALYDICVRTGLAGGDARGHYADDDLLPNIYAAPYVEFAPDLAFVVDDGARAVGYVVGTADTAGYAQWFARRWLPALVERYPPLAGPPRTEAEHMIDNLYHPERMVLPELAGHPAHLHINLLPGHQGAGHGRKLITTFLAALRAKGVPGVHLGYDERNIAARRFYDRLGFAELPVRVPGVVYLGRSTA